MRPQDFELLARLLKERSGLVVSPEKVYLLESRLAPVARRFHLDSLDKLADELRYRPTESLLRDVTEAMTTNESFFFRDTTPFDLLQKQILPMLVNRRAAQKRIRIWCAACSTGQEPYSIAMLLNEQKAKWAGWQIEILGTDLSTSVLRRAQEGIYSQFEVQRGLPIQLMVKYFTQVGDAWQLAKDIRDMVQFRELNLLASFSSLGTFDVVFCRNVLIYFDEATKSEVLNRIRQVMPTDGSLILGAAETVLGICDRFKPVRGARGLYAPSEFVAQAELAAKAS
ncbi:MAG: protein-glutamate O-methyltransferase CheR [Alphaproteobacteria bacterium]|nr:MAG: protein-glutamate O-methyltransferase CheR [Alphaproteobacteria bacterium]